jgi:hypothetical protein
MSLALVEAVVLMAAGVAALFAFVDGLIGGNAFLTLCGLAGYVAVWAYGLMRASYSGPSFSG